METIYYVHLIKSTYGEHSCNQYRAFKSTISLVGAAVCWTPITSV